MDTQKVAIITGASRGIGRAMAIYFSKKNYHVALLARSEAALDELKRFLATKTQQGSNCASVYPIDVSNEQDVKQAIADIVQTRKRIDVLFNNAGIAIKGTSSLAANDFERMLAVNLKGAFYLIQNVAAQMKQQQSGYIFNLASQSGKRAVSSLGGYAASKFALVGFNEALYRELLPEGINVTAICPGLVNTDMTSGSLVDAGDMIQPEDIATTVDYLLSLGDSVCIKEIIVQCKKQIIKEFL